jgi:short-subunit dehydrogenase
VSDNVAVVTGASGGVGRAIARAFGSEGFDVALIARESERLHEACRDLEREGVRALPIAADVAAFASLEAAAERVEAELGEIGVWVNDAMTSVLAPFTEITPDEFHRVTDVVYHGYVHGTRVALDQMRRRDRGTIIQVGSALAYRGIPLQSAYCGAKHAINGFSESVRTELLHDSSSVRVCVAQMPAMNTPQFEWVRTRLRRHPQPVPPIYEPEVAAQAVMHLVRHPRREMWVGASTIATIVANRLVPAALDRYLGRTGYDSQQTAEPVDPGRADNLETPVEKRFDEHGCFGDRASARSAALWCSMHRGLLSVVGVAAASAAAFAWARHHQ